MPGFGGGVVVVEGLDDSSGQPHGASNETTIPTIESERNFSVATIRLPFAQKLQIRLG
jgi:hypothetical protein